MEWLEHVQRLLVAAAVPEGERVNVLQIQLTGVARAWFDVEFVGAERDVPWEVFASRFKEQFFPTDAQEDLAEKFLRLEQGDRSVDDYAYEFTWLSRIALSIAPTDEVRARRFIRGLR